MKKTLKETHSEKKTKAVNTSANQQRQNVVFDNFIERVGLAAENDGLPRIAGRMMGLLVLIGGPISFADIAIRLQVSKASISNNAKLLTALGIIQRVSVPGNRQDYYKIEEKPYLKLMQGHVERSNSVKKMVSETITHLADESPELLARLDEMEQFYGSMVWFAEGVISRIKDA